LPLSTSPTSCSSTDESRRLIKRLGDALPALAAQSTELYAAIGAAVAGSRAAGYSWGDRRSVEGEPSGCAPALELPGRLGWLERAERGVMTSSQVLVLAVGCSR
jgi:hypothetical protein